jgi:ribosome-associated protein
MKKQGASITETLDERVVDDSIIAESDQLELLDLVISICSDVKGENLVVIDVRPYSSVSDFIVIVSGRSDTQVQGIGNRLIEQLKVEMNLSPIGVEGLESGQWVLVDYGDIVIHAFYSTTRELYDIEGMWLHAKSYQPATRDDASNSDGVKSRTKKLAAA